MRFEAKDKWGGGEINPFAVGKAVPPVTEQAKSDGEIKSGEA